jgi:hypothetical protein
MDSREFKLRHLIIFTAALILVGFTAAHLVQKTIFDPARPEVRERILNASIEQTLCQLIERDLETFKQSPLNFVRSDLETLIAEATKISVASTPMVKTEAIYTGGKTDYLKRCTKRATQWLRITTLASNQLEQDYSYLPQTNGHTKATESINSVLETPRPETKSPEKSINARALVIGNSSYRDRPLRNPINDANAMAKELKTLGFKVDIVMDASAIELKRATEEFVQNIPIHDVNLLFYSGHGVEIAGRNYLIPSDAEIRRLGEFARQATDLTKLVTEAEKYPDAVSVFIIDACRTLPTLSDTRGVSNGMSEIKLKKASGIIVAFSTSPGSVALDGNEKLSPYTTALLRHLQSQRTDVETLLKNVTQEVRVMTNGRQVPWYSSSLVGQISLDAK